MMQRIEKLFTNWFLSAEGLEKWNFSELWASIPHPMSTRTSILIRPRGPPKNRAFEWENSDTCIDRGLSTL
jgi:hypothetical protein